MCAVPVRWKAYGKQIETVEASIVEEALININVNGRHVAALMASPKDQDWLAAGFLLNGRMIESVDEIISLHISKHGCCVEVWLDHELRKPEKRIITSGCGGGVLFEDPETVRGRIDDSLTVPVEELYRMFDMLQQASEMHAETGGIHSSALFRNGEMVGIVEDIGRHNTIDKLCGFAALHGLDTKGTILLTTGRISSEMMVKAALMGCPIVASRNSPTSLSCEIARAWNIMLIGYVRRRSLRVYAHAERMVNHRDSPSSL